MTDPIDYVVRDPEALKAHGGSRSKRLRDEEAGHWARRFKLTPNGAAVGWWASEIREAQKRRKQQATEGPTDKRPRDQGRFAPAAE